MRLGKRERKALRLAEREIDAKRKERINAVPVTAGKFRAVGSEPLVRGKPSRQWGKPDHRRNGPVTIYAP